MRIALALLGSILGAMPAMAAMSAAEFAARVTGKTIYYTTMGTPSGVEEYLPGQRARWMDRDGTCIEGTWFESAGTICFDYPDYGPVQCWIVDAIGEQLRAYRPGSSPVSGFISYREDDTPLPCPAADLGV